MRIVSYARVQPAVTDTSGVCDRHPTARAPSSTAHPPLMRLTNATAPAPHSSQPKPRRAGMKVSFAVEENEEHEWDEDLEAVAQVRAIGRAGAGAWR